MEAPHPLRHAQPAAGHGRLVQVGCKLRAQPKLEGWIEGQMQTAAWLHGMGLDQYEPVFRDNAIEADILPELTEADLEKLGVALLGHRKRLLKAIAALSE